MKKEALVLFWWSSQGYRWELLKAGLSLMVAAALAVGIAVVALSVEQGLRPLLSGGGLQLRVRPASLQLGPLNLAGALFRPRRLDEAVLQTLKQLPTAATVWPELWSRFPVGLSGSILGQGLYSDGALLGLPEEAVSRELRRPFRWTPGEVVPVLAPLSLFAVYNGSFAPANGFPKLSPESVVGLRFTIVAGQSSFGALTQRPVKLEAELVGLTRYGDALAAIVPLDTVAYLEQALKMPESGTWSSLLVTLTPGADAEAAREKIRAQGFVAEELGVTLRQLELALKSLKQAAVAVSMVGVGLALLVLMQVSRLLLRERAGALRALWALGFSRRALRMLLGLEQLGLTLGLLGLGALGGGGAGGSLLPWVVEVIRQSTGLVVSLPVVWPWKALAALGLLSPLLVWLGTRRALEEEWEPVRTWRDS